MEEKHGREFQNIMIQKIFIFCSVNFYLQIQLDAAKLTSVGMKEQIPRCYGSRMDSTAKGARLVWRLTVTFLKEGK